MRTLRLLLIPPTTRLFLRWSYHRYVPTSLPPVVNARPTGQEVLGSAPPRSRPYCGGDEQTSQVPGEPWWTYADFSDPGGIGVPRPYRAPTRSPLVLTTRTPSEQETFRGSIDRPSSWLSTLRRDGRPSTTQDSLPAAGHALPGGIGYPQGSDERFPDSLHPSPFPRLHLTQQNQFRRSPRADSSCRRRPGGGGVAAAIPAMSSLLIPRSPLAVGHQ